jgi:type I restriction enzyme S subunit
MELTETKYKQTEVGLIPFHWKELKIGEIGDTYGGLSGKRKEDFKDGRFPYITFLNVMMNTVIDTRDVGFVNIKGGEQQNSVRKGDLFFNTSSETPEEVGMCAVLLEYVPYLYLNSFCFGFRLKEDVGIDGLFLSYLINSSLGRRLFLSLAQGATRYNLSKKNFNNVKIYAPTLEEQKAIAQVLSDTDALIQALEKKIAKKKLIKKGVMQKLLKPKEGWKKVEMKEVMEFANGKPLEPMVNQNGAYNLITLDSISIEGKLKNYHKKVSINDNSLRKNDVVTVLSDIAHAKLLGLTDLIPSNNLYVLNQRMGRLRFSDEIHPKFASQFINHKQEYFRKRGQGSSQRHIYKKDFDEFILSYPLHNEQIQIAQSLSDMDEEIIKLIQKLSKYQMAKQGMMQQLLTGRIRLV